jgi:hypothetical protein
MPYRLKNGIYAVRCRYPQCPFHSQVEIQSNLVGVTQKDVEAEARKLARDMGLLKHDAVYGTRHALRNPEIRKISGTFEPIGAGPMGAELETPEVFYRDYRRGEIILQKGDDATTLCEVVRGYAFPERNSGHRYGVGECFGAAALLANQQRTTNVISGSDNTRVAFYNLIELSKKNPKKARQLFNDVMEDTFKVIHELENSVDRCRREIQREAVRG